MDEPKRSQTSTLKSLLKAYALPIAGASFAVGVACAGASLTGYFNDQVKYCDGRTNPCTWIVVPDWMPLPQEAKFQSVQPGSKGLRLLAGIGGVIAFPGAFVAFSVALHKQRQLDENREQQSVLENARTNILTDEETQRLAIASDLRVKDFQRQLLDGYAELYLLEHPELIDSLASTESPPQPTSEPLLQETDAKHLPPTNDAAIASPNNVEGTEAPLTQYAAADPYHEYRRVGTSIIKSMVVSDKSLLIASGTGTGKSTTEQYFLQQFVTRYPQSEIYALLNKNDDLYGVRRERLVVFSPEALLEMPNDKEERTALIKQLLAPLYTVYGIFLTRKQKPTSERKRLKESHPIRLVLGDWYGTYQELQARLTKDELQGVLSMIRQIITIGRDMGVGLVVDTQSANLDSLGLASDASIRQSLDIFSQGFIYYEDGEEKGELQTIRLMFGNKSICSPEDREVIAQTYNFLADAIKDAKLKTPIIFTSVGSRPRLGIVPDLSDGLSTKTNVDWSDVARQLDATYLRSEFMVNPIVPPESEEVNELPLTDKHNAILNYLKANGSRTLKQIADSRRLGLPETRNLLKDLIERELVELEDELYRLANT